MQGTKYMVMRRTGNVPEFEIRTQPCTSRHPVLRTSDMHSHFFTGMSTETGNEQNLHCLPRSTLLQI